MSGYPPVGSVREDANMVESLGDHTLASTSTACVAASLVRTRWHCGHKLLSCKGDEQEYR